MTLNGKEAPDETFSDKFSYTGLQDAISSSQFVILVLGDSSYAVAMYKAAEQTLLEELKLTFKNKLCRGLHNTLKGKVNFISYRVIFNGL